MLQLGLYVKYKGIEYGITVNMDGNIKIMTEDLRITDKTFKNTYHSGVYTKIVNPNELVDCVSVEFYGVIPGKNVQVLQEKENKYQIGTGDLLIGSHLNLPRVDRDTWLGWVPKVKLI
jgi:hypothetical protein